MNDSFENSDTKTGAWQHNVTIDAGCKHQWQLKETKKEQGIWDASRSRPWVRIDIYFCVHCLEEMTTRLTGEVQDYPKAPDWW